MLNIPGSGTLRSVLDDEALELSWDRRIGFALDAAEGMSFLHQLDPPAIHRDLKSGNLLISEGWTVKVADFGTARLFQKIVWCILSSSTY